VIFNNLISNSIRYSNTWIEHSFISIEVTIENRTAFIKIEDNGLGISAEHLPRIFEMFYRATQHVSGSGLGLFIVKETVDKLGGKISVSSTPNMGTTFTLELPNFAPFDQS
jgi:signal transduction histidine kinase